MRLSFVLFCMLLVLAGCGTRPEPLPQLGLAPSGQTAAPAVPQTAGDSQPALEDCRGTQHVGQIHLFARVPGVSIRLSLSSCRLTVPAGETVLAVWVLSDAAGADLNPKGAAGSWDGREFRVPLTLGQGESRSVTLDLSPLGVKGPLTFMLVGDGAPAAPLASAPARSGPWTPVPANGFIPGEHGWLRLNYPRPMKTGQTSAVSPDQYREGTGLPVTWEGDRVQYIEISKASPVLFLRTTQDAAGLSVDWREPWMLFRGQPPELQGVAPADLAVRLVHRFAEAPSFARYEGGAVRYLTYPSAAGEYGRGRKLDLATGKVEEVPTRSLYGAEDGFRFPSPDGKLVAELVFVNGLPGHMSEHTKRVANLIIREAGSGKTLLQLDNWLHSWGAYGCSRSDPGFGWRADSQAVAALHAPEVDRLVLKVADLKGTTREVAVQQRPEAGYEQMTGQAVWAPSGSLISFNGQVVEAASGKVIADGLPDTVFWSQDSRYLLLHKQDHVFTNWGEVSLLDAATGKRRVIGGGMGLGWTPAGEALVLRWDAPRNIPAPPRGCE